MRSRPLKFLLIKPATPEWRLSDEAAGAGRTQMFRYSMLSSLYVAAAMPPFVETRILDEEVEPIDYDLDADRIGLSFMTCSAPRAYEIASRFRKEKHKPVIAGGYHPTFLPEEVLQHVDAVCIGEAETLWPTIVADAMARFAGLTGRRYELFEYEGAPDALASPTQTHGHPQRRYMPLRAAPRRRHASELPHQRLSRQRQ